MPKAQYNARDQKLPDVYRAFWRSVIGNAVVERQAPTIITLNYDLVLERSLIASLAGTEWSPDSSKPFPYRFVRINYHCATVRDVVLEMVLGTFTRLDGRSVRGYQLVAREECDERNTLTISILKPHGSLNFPSKQVGDWDFQTVQNAPIIMPPVFNKSSASQLAGVWERALDSLRSAVHVVICGYSLPKTDMYMQYFLKAALGPNTDLSKLFVFDPVLYQEGPRRAEMKERFASVFSEQLRPRIEFEPFVSSSERKAGAGTFGVLVSAIANRARELIFV